MRVLIIEDESAAYDNLCDMLHSLDPSICIVGNTEGVEQSVRWLKANPLPDLIFMDIHLSDGSAFAIFDMIQVETPIIFTTAYDQYAINAFKVNSIDYLLKPIKSHELEGALSKFRKLSKGDVAQYVAQLSQLHHQQTYCDRLLISHRDKIIPINISDISCIYSTDNKKLIIKRDGTSYPHTKTLGETISLLDPTRFIRANKQYIIARDSVREITVWFNNRLRITLDTDTPEPIFVSKNKATEFKAWIIREPSTTNRE